MTEPRRTSRRKKILLGLLFVLVLGGGIAWLQKTALLAWYYGYRLERAAADQRQPWADRLADLGEPAVPRLLDSFRKDDPALCDTVRQAMDRMVQQWGGTKDPRSLAMIDRCLEAFPSFSPAGQIATLQFFPNKLEHSSVESTARARTVVTSALKDRVADLRVLGVAAAMREELNLTSAVVPLLDDSDARVRRAAMLAVAPLKENSGEQPLLSSDELLRWLHDSDADVRRICEMSLRSRGLRDLDVRLGRLLVHPNPLERLQLVLDLPEEENLDIGVWLQRLSTDSVPAVRVAAARVGAEQRNRVNFALCLDEMSRTDPDETVRRIAVHYRRFFDSR